MLNALLHPDTILFIATLLIVLLFLLRISFVRKLLLMLLGVIPALFMLVYGVVAMLFWRPAAWLFHKIPGKEAIENLAERVLAWRGSWSEKPLLTGDRLSHANMMWPQQAFPFLYNHLPLDIVRPPWEDGKLVGGYDVAWLADRHLTGATLRSATSVAATTAILIFLLALAVWFGVTLNELWQGGKFVFAEPRLVAEVWPGDQQVSVPLVGWLLATLQACVSAFGDALARSAKYIVPWSAFALGSAMFVFLVVLKRWQSAVAAPYEAVTKDADVRWPFRAESRRITNATYIRQVEHALGYLADTSEYHLGVATGTLRARGDLSAPMSGQKVLLDDESLSQHLLVLGGTGEGKTSAVLRPLMDQIFADSKFGAYVCDAKGVLWADAREAAIKAGREGDIVVVGTDAGHNGVDVLAGLSPSEVSTVLRSVLQQLNAGGGSQDNFWPDMASNLMRHILTVAGAYALTPDARAETQDTGTHPYSLWWLYQCIVDEEQLDNAIESVLKTVESERAKLSEKKAQADSVNHALFRDDVRASIRYLKGPWKEMAGETKTGIVASATQLLDPLAGAETLRERFARGQSEAGIAIGEALDGKIVVNALSSIEDGLAARLINVLLKTSLYRQARLRETRFLAQKISPRSKPCAVIIDEVQEIVTADPASGLSDATFWNVARSSGLVGIFATQTVAALRQALGKDASDNFLQQTRSKIFFRSEDTETIEYACWCAGEFERGRVFDDEQRESIEFREVIDGWHPLLPIREERLRGGGRLFFDTARSLLFPADSRLDAARPRRAYEADDTYVPGAYLTWNPHEASIVQQTHLSQLAAKQAAAWRAEDLERKYRAEGNERMKALTATDLIGMGRWHAYAHIQRAGVARQDIIRVTHVFGDDSAPQGDTDEK